MEVFINYYDEDKKKIDYKREILDDLYNPDVETSTNTEEFKHIFNVELFRAQLECDGYNTDLASGDLTIHKCKDCGIYFFTNKSEEEWFKNKKMSTPKRCLSCRRKRRIEATNKISNL